MNVNHLIDDGKAVIRESFLYPRISASETKNGGAVIAYNGLVLHDRCVVDSGTGNGDSALLDFRDLRFKFNIDSNSYKYASITFKGVVVETQNKDSSDTEARWVIGLKDDNGNNLFVLSPYNSAIGTRVRVDYLNQSNEMDISRNYKIYDGYRSDVTFQFYASQEEFRILKNGIGMNPTNSALSDVQHHGLNGKILHPFLYAKNVNGGRTRISLDEIEVTAIPIINIDNFIYN